jgi:hypothetical protein
MIMNKIAPTAAALGCAAVLIAAAPATDPTKVDAPQAGAPAGQTCSTPSLRIDVTEVGKPAASISIPIWMIKSASKLVSASAGKALGVKVDLDELVALATDPNARGVLLEVEDHRSKDRVVISICREPAAQK